MLLSVNLQCVVVCTCSVESQRQRGAQLGAIGPDVSRPALHACTIIIGKMDVILSVNISLEFT